MKKSEIVSMIHGLEIELDEVGEDLAMTISSLSIKLEEAKRELDGKIREMEKQIAYLDSVNKNFFMPISSLVNQPYGWQQVIPSTSTKVYTGDMLPGQESS